MKYNVLMVLIGMIILIIIYNSFTKDQFISRDIEPHLKEDGFCICKSVLTEEQCDFYKGLCSTGKYQTVKERIFTEPLLQKCKERIGNDYQFQDYIFIIQRSAVHTCHRDNNGDFFNETQKHPSYTLLIFLEDMEKCLGVIPESHTSLYRDLFYWYDPIKNILCKRGDAILFNANLIHVGTINDKDNIRIQLKLTHRDDIAAIDYYEKYNKVLNEPNQIPVAFRKIQQRASCMFPIISNWTQQEYTDILKKKKDIGNPENPGNPGFFEQIFSYFFYGDPNYYELKDAF